MSSMFQGNRFGLGAITRKVLCATLSFAVLNASLAPVYGTSEAFQTDQHETYQARKSSPKKIPETGYLSWIVNGLVDLVSRSASYILKHPGEALVAGLATQIAFTNAIQPLTDEFLINQNTTGIQTNPSIAVLENGNAFVTWQGNQTKTYDILGRVFSATGASLGDELTINQNTAGDQYYPSVTALNNGNAFVAWMDYNSNIYGRGISPAGVGLGNEVLIIQVIQPSLSLASLNDGNVFLAFEAGSNIYGRILAPNGTILSGFPSAINRYSGSRYPSGTTLSNNSIFVTWQGTQTGNLDIYGRVMLPNGTAFRDEFTINQIVAGDQTKSSVAALGNDKILVVWQGDQAGNLDIYGRFFSESGAALSNQIKINQVTDGNQANASVTALDNGHAFVVWEGDQTGSPRLYGRVVLSNGTFLGDEVLLNQQTTLTGTQIDPQVKLLKNGKVLLVWTDDRAGTPDIYGRTFDPYSDPVVTTSSVATTNKAGAPDVDLEKTLLTVWGVGSSVAATVSLCVSLSTLCTIGGFLGFKAYKKHQLKKPAENSQQQAAVELRKTDSPEDLYGSTNDPYIREALKEDPTYDTYGTPPAFLPGGDSFQGDVKPAPEAGPKSPNSTVPQQPRPQSARPQSIVEEGDPSSLYGKVPTILKEESQTQ